MIEIGGRVLGEAELAVIAVGLVLFLMLILLIVAVRATGRSARATEPLVQTLEYRPFPDGSEHRVLRQRLIL